MPSAYAKRQQKRRTHVMYSEKGLVCQAGITMSMPSHHASFCPRRPVTWASTDARNDARTAFDRPQRDNTKVKASRKKENN